MCRYVHFAAVPSKLILLCVQTVNPQPQKPIMNRNLNQFPINRGLIQWVCAAMAMMFMLPALQAQSIISLRIGCGSVNGTNYMFPADKAGAPGVRTNNWNNIPAPFNANSPSTIATNLIYDSSGTVIPNAGVTWYFGGGGSDGWFDRLSPTVSTNDGKMLADVADVYNNTAIANFGYLDVTNIPYTNYNVYCYFRDDNGSGAANTRGGVWVITNTPSGAQRIYIQNQSNDVNQTQIPLPNTSGVGYAKSTTTSIPSGGAAWSSIQGGNYGVFTGLTNSHLTVFFNALGNGTSATDDLGNYVNSGSSARRFKVPAFQIVQVPGGVIDNLYFQPTTTTLHAGNPAGAQATVLADLVSGTIGVNVTAAATYSSDNTNVVTVTTAGLLYPGTNGTAHVIASYQSLTATNLVTVIGPASLSISVANTNLLSGANGIGDQTVATLYANFADANNVVVNAYDFVSFSGTAGVITITTNGTLAAIGPGPFSVTGTYDGLSVITNNAGIITRYSPPTGAPSFAVKLTDAIPAHQMSFHDLSGAPGVRFAYWNNLAESFGNVTNQIVAPYDFQGNSLPATTVQQVLTAQTSQLIGTVGTQTTNESLMFGVYSDVGDNDGVTVLNTLIVSNVPYSSYDVYLYVENDNTTSGTNRPGEFIIDGITQYRINNMADSAYPDNNGNGYVLAAPQPSGLPASVVDVPFGNYVKFSAITDNVLTISYGGLGQDYIGDAAVVMRMRIAGLQIVKSLDGLTATNVYLAPVSVPAQLPGDPATYSLTVLADFTDGTKGGNITSLAGVGYLSSNTNVFSVDTNGIITPGLTPGKATLTVSYQANTLTTTVTNLAPISVQVTAIPNTVYLNSILGVQPAQAILMATFADYGNVDVSGFNGVTFVDQGSAAASLSSSGVITANSVGEANLGATYLGTTWTSANAFTVANTGGAAVLKHQYALTNDLPGSTVIVDSVGGANGTVNPPVAPNLPITLDGQRAIFPGDAGYTNEPWISLPAGLISAMGDVTIELWCGQSQLNTWARFLGFGNTPKGTDPQVYGGTATSGIQIMASYGSTGKADFAGPGSGDLYSPYALTNGVEYHIVAVCAPNAGVAQLYINGVLVASGTPSAAYLNSSVDDTVDWLGVSLSNDDSPLAGWINQLSIYEGVLSGSQVAADYAAGQSVYLPPFTTATNSVPLQFSVSGGNLNIAWPPDHKGWTLQVQTNSLNSGLGVNWVAAPNSTTVTNMTIPINPANGSVFYRLYYQP
jgi:hypothetical protein